VNQVADVPVPIERLHAGLEIPAELRASVQRHEQHLAQLVGTLRAAGLDAATIDASVRQLVDSYRDELITAIHSMVEGARDA
jgi:sirohydrochlorin ferrochelatase